MPKVVFFGGGEVVFFGGGGHPQAGGVGCSSCVIRLVWDIRVCVCVILQSCRCACVSFIIIHHSSFVVR